MKRITMFESLAYIQDGMTLMMGSAELRAVSPLLTGELLQKRVRNLTLVIPDIGSPDQEFLRLVGSGTVSQLVTSCIYLPNRSESAWARLLQISLLPKSVLMERIRAGAHGLGGILTPIGIGTDLEVGKPIITVDGRRFLLEKPLFADIAILCNCVGIAGKCQECGLYEMNRLMAEASELVLVYDKPGTRTLPHCEKLDASVDFYVHDAAM